MGQAAILFSITATKFPSQNQPYIGDDMGSGNNTLRHAAGRENAVLNREQSM